MKRQFCLLTILLTLALVPRKGFGQWVQTNGPYGASVLSITHLGNDIFIGAVGGIFESTDGGSSWQRKSNGLPDGLDVYSLTTRGPNIFAETYSKVYRSTDTGATWSLASAGLPASITIFSLGSSIHSVFALCGAYSYISTNDGNGWKLIDTNLTKFSNPQCVMTVDSITYLAGAWITQTSDDGLNWAVTAVPPSGTSWGIGCMANIGNSFFANDGGGAGILLSMNRGLSWEMTDLPPFLLGTKLFAFGSEIFADAENGSVYRTTDLATWQLASSGLPIDARLTAFGAQLTAFESIGSELLASYYGPGMYRSFDSGKTWTQCNQGLSGTSINAIASAGDTTYVGTTGGVFLSADNGMSWQSKYNGLTSYNIASLLIDNGNIYAGTEGVYRSIDGGENWNYPDSTEYGYFIRSMGRLGNTLFAGGDNDEILESGDDGAEWSALNPDFVQGGSISIYQFLNFSGRLFAATSNGLYLTYDGVFWQKSLDGIAYSKQIIVSAIGTVGSKVFIYCRPDSSSQNLGIFVSGNFGLSWQAASDTVFPARGHVTGFATTGDSLFAATDSDGIFLSIDSGVHWTSENSDLGDSSILSIALQSNELLAGTASSGVWRRPLIPPSSVASRIPTSETISVYPDPASSLVTISCPGLKGKIEARLISITGVTVWRKMLDADGRPFQLNFSGITNGSYRLELVSGDERQAINIVLKR